MVGDGSLGEGQRRTRGAMASTMLASSNHALTSPQIPTQTYTSMPQNSGTIPKSTKERDFQLYPPVQDQSNKQLVPHNLDRYAYKGK